MRILQVMHDVPFPPRGGGRVDMWGRLRALASLGHEVDVLIAVWERPAADVVSEICKYASDLILCFRIPMWKGLFGALPCQAASRGSLASVSLSRTYELVLIDGDSVGPVLENPSLRARYRVLRTHNWEAKYFEERSRIEGAPRLMRAYDKIESRRYPSYSNSLLARCDAVWWVSSDELKEACGGVPDLSLKSKWLPHFHDVSRTRNYSPSSHQTVLFVGALSSLQNIEAIRWYLDRIHPKLVRLPEYQFVVAGGTDNRILPASIERMTGDPRCHLMKDVPDLTDLYKSARVFVNPVLHGAGINSKTIHAISEGLPIVTTSPGYRGTGLKPGVHLLVEDEADNIASALAEILEGKVNAEEMVREAQKFLIDHYDHPKCIEALIADLERSKIDNSDSRD